MAGSKASTTPGRVEVFIPTPAPIVVHVLGAVQNEGAYKLPPGLEDCGMRSTLPAEQTPTPTCPASISRPALPTAPDYTSRLQTRTR